MQKNHTLIVSIVLCLLFGRIAAHAENQTSPAVQQDKIFSVQKESSTLRYTILVKKVLIGTDPIEGTSKQVRGKAVFKPDGSLQVQLSVPVDSFDSGNSNRDAHMKESTEAARFPNVTVKATVPSFSLPTAFAKTQTYQNPPPFVIEVDFHGQKKQGIPLNSDLKIVFETEKKIHVTGKFGIKLTDFKVDPPSNLLGALKVQDPVTISFDVVFIAET